MDQANSSIVSGVPILWRNIDNEDHSLAILDSMFTPRISTIVKTIASKSHALHNLPFISDALTATVTHVSNTANTNKMMKKRITETVAATASHGG